MLAGAGTRHGHVGSGRSCCDPGGVAGAIGEAGDVLAVRGNLNVAGAHPTVRKNFCTSPASSLLFLYTTAWPEDRPLDRSRKFTGSSCSLMRSTMSCTAKKASMSKASMSCCEAEMQAVQADRHVNVRGLAREGRVAQGGGHSRGADGGELRASSHRWCCGGRGRCKVATVLASAQPSTCSSRHSTPS